MAQDSHPWPRADADLGLRSERQRSTDEKHRGVFQSDGQYQGRGQADASLPQIGLVKAGVRMGKV